MFVWLKKVVSEAIFLDNTTRNRTWSEADQGGSGRPGVGCFGGLARGQKDIDLVIEMGTIGSVRMCHLQCFVGVDSENVSENHNDSYETDSSEVIDANQSTVSIRHCQVSLKRLTKS